MTLRGRGFVAVRLLVIDRIALRDGEPKRHIQ